MSESTSHGLGTRPGVDRDSDQIVLPRVLARNAREHPNRPYLKMVDGEWLSYAEIWRRTERWAAILEAVGVQSGDRVAVLLPTSTESVEVWAAVAHAGGIEVPIHTELRGDMLSHVFNNSGATVAVIAESLLDAIVPIVHDLEALREVVVVLESGEELPDLGAEAISLHRSSQFDLSRPVKVHTPDYWDTCAIMYTSGTTGPAKGVMIPWGQFYSGIHGLFPDVGEEGCFYVPLPLHHIAGRGLVYRSALVLAQAVLRPRFSVTDYWNDVVGNGCTATILMGAMADMLMQGNPAGDPIENPLSKVLMSPLIGQAEAFAQRFGVALRTNFGMTEIGAPITGGVERPLANLTSCGQVREGYICRVVNERDEEVLPNEIGELVVRTEAPWVIMSGYWNDPSKTVEAWRNQWFHTGDAFRYDDDGNFYYMDRVKDTIRRAGENISSFHIEQELLRLPGVAECAVVGVPTDIVEEEVRVFVVLDSETSESVQSLSEQLAPRVARFMLPRYWTVVPELPKTPTLRVKKSLLREIPIDADTWDRRA